MADEAQPEDLPFSLQEGEAVQLFTRRHPIYFVLKAAWYALAAVLPIAVVTWIVAIAGGLDGIGATVMALIDLAWFLFWAVRGYFLWYGYHNDIWVVTNQRIIDSTKRNWFDHKMASADLVDVEDIAVHKQGLLPTAFNFGDLQCQTAGERLNFVLAGIPKPAEVLGKIDALRDSARRELRKQEV